jgi:hypothetical protein
MRLLIYTAILITYRNQASVNRQPGFANGAKTVAKIGKQQHVFANVRIPEQVLGPLIRVRCLKTITYKIVQNFSVRYDNCLHKT